MVKQTWKGLLLSQKSTIREISIICACSDHSQPRYQIWIKSNKDKWLVAYTRCADGYMVKQTWKELWLSQKSTIREIGIICACSDHGQPRYQIWIKSNKRQMTSCVHKMCGRTYGQTNMKRAITLAKINHPWNRYNMRMLRSWPTKTPNMNKIQQKTND
jgi:seryl-tRNA synthetase